MALYIEKCIKKYEDNFPFEWIEGYDWDEPNERNSFSTSHSIIEKYTNECLVNLCKSALSGEYINKSQNTEEAFNKLEALFANEYESLDSEETTNKLKTEIYVKYESLDRGLKSCIIHYKSLLSLISTKIDEYDHDFVFNMFSEKKEIIDQKFLFFNEFVIELCKIDHMLSYSKNSITRLLLMWEHVKDLSNKNDKEMTEIYKILIEKCSFLIKKMLHISGNSEYCYNFTTYKLKEEDINLSFLNDLYDNFEDLHGKKTDANKTLLLQVKCSGINPKISEIVLLMKYYQKDSGTEKQIQYLLDKFDCIYDRLYPVVITRPFNKHALNTTKNYLYNCFLSFKISKTPYSFEKLKKDIKEIEDIQTETRIKNFYPYRKAICFLNRDISSDIDNYSSNNLRECINTKLIELELYIERFGIAIKWCQSQNFYPFQLMSNECCVNFGESKLKIFIPSSFTRPIEYEPLFEELKEYKEKLLFFRNRIELIEEKSKIKSLKTEIEKSEKKYIEILGLFVAVITFLFGSINFFATTRDFPQLIKSSFSLGLILLLFSSAIYFLTISREDKFEDYLSHPKFWFFGITTILYFIILIKSIS